jgi:glycosyltransferase involved in cell wall biosynthesis
MRVVMVCPSYPPREVTCGVGDYTRCLAEELVRQGEEVTVVTSAGYSGETDGVVTVLPVLDGSAWRSAWWCVETPDIVNVQYTPDLYRSLAGVKLVPLHARLTREGPSVVVTFHTLLDGSLGARIAVPWLLATAAHSISANEEVSAMIRRRLPRLAKRCTEIPIGSNIAAAAGAPASSRREERTRLGLPADAPILVHFGLVYPGKGLETLFEALAVLRRSVPDVRLLIVGDTRPEERSFRTGLETLAERAGIAPAVTWVGRRPGEEVSRLLQAADLYVVPYDAGATIRRGSLIAGLAHGLPVVSTRAALASAYLRDGQNVALVPPRDPGALAARLAHLLATPEETARLRHGARNLSERFAWPVIAAETRRVFARVRATRSARGKHE